MRQRRPHPHHRERQEQDRVGHDQLQRALIQRQRVAHRERHEAQRHDQSGERLGQEREALDQDREPVAVAHRRGRHRDRQRRGQRGGARAELRRVCRVGEDRGRRQRRRAAVDQPVDQRAEWHSERQATQREQAAQRGDRPATPQSHPDDCAPSALAGACPVPAPDQRQLARERRHPERHQHQRQRAGRRGVEAELELGEDRHRECLVLDDLKRPVLGQQPERHQQAAAEHRRQHLTQRHLPEDLPRSQSETARDLLQGRVHAGQTGDRGQVHQRVERQRHDHHRRLVSLQAVIQGDPAEADHEVGDAQRQHQQHRPHAAGRDRRALHAPGRGHPDHRAQRRARDHEAQRVPQQHGGVVAEQQARCRAPSRLLGLDHEEHQRQQHQPGRERRAEHGHQRRATSV